MREISFPPRRDSNNELVTHDSNSPQAAAELAGHVIACAQGERPLAPDYGLPDPDTDSLSPALIAGAIAFCEPEIQVRSVEVRQTGSNEVKIAVDVEWSQS